MFARCIRYLYIHVTQCCGSGIICMVGCGSLINFGSDLDPDEKRYVFLTENCVPVASGVYISVRKLYLFPPPFKKLKIFPLSRHVVSRFPSWPFCLNPSLFCNYFSLSFPLFSFSFPFLPFSFTFPSFFSLPFHIFPPKWHRLIIFPPPQGGRGIFRYIDPWVAFKPLKIIILCFESNGADRDLYEDNKDKVGHVGYKSGFLKNHCGFTALIKKRLETMWLFLQASSKQPIVSEPPGKAWTMGQTGRAFNYQYRNEHCPHEAAKMTASDLKQQDC
jgi:hypothetical protein